MSTPLVAAFVFHGCESPTAPRFPEPIEEPDTVTNDDEGATGRRPLSRLPFRLGQDVRLFLIQCVEVGPCQ